ARIQLARLEGARVARVRQAADDALVRHAWKLREKVAASVSDRFRELALVIREIEKRFRRTEFLPLKEQRRHRTEQQPGGQRAVPAGSAALMETPAVQGVGDLIVVLEIRDEVLRQKIERRRASRLLLPFVPLSLIEVAEAAARDEFLRGPQIVPVIRFAAAGQ